MKYLFAFCFAGCCVGYALIGPQDYEYQKDFERWVNHKAIFKTVEWKDYKNRAKPLTRYEV